MHRSTMQDVLTLASFEHNPRQWQDQLDAIPAWHPRNEKTPEELAAEEEAAAAAAVEAAARTVPLATLTAERRKAAAATKELEELKAWKAEQEAKDQSDAEREKARADAAEAKIADLEGAAKKQSKRSMIAEAAKGFHNPGAAAAMLDPDTFESIESPEDAAAAVKALGEREQWLLKPAEKEPTGVQKILSDGKPVDPKLAEGAKKPPTLDEVKAMSHDEINARWDEIQPVLAQQQS